MRTDGVGALAFFMAGAAMAASIEGRVFDPDTAAAPDVRVEVMRDGARQAAVKSGADGGFRVDALPAGVYEVKVLAPGFARAGSGWGRIQRQW